MTAPSSTAIETKVVPAALKEPQAASEVESRASSPGTSTATATPTPGGTVVIDVEEGGIEVPSFLGKSVRAALESAEDAGLDLDAIGSGTAREQSPVPGSHVAAGSRVVVRFGR